MFNNKESFKAEFTKRAVEKYCRAINQIHISEKYLLLGEMVKDFASYNWKESKEVCSREDKKQLTYLSMEFLIGRLLTNNLINLGIYNVAKEGLNDLGIDIHELENIESDAGLGNGGLGRLAACFLDSLVTLNYPGHGNTLRYDFGFFKQKIKDNKQVEVPDQWMRHTNVWETYKPKHAVEVKFYGKVKVDYVNGECKYSLVDAKCVRAVPYDIPVIGYKTRNTNTLRLWAAEPSEEQLPSNMAFGKYLSEVREICQCLYPDDSTEDGKILRLKQQYFLVSSTIQSLLRSHKRNYGTFDNFYEKNVIQLNDTHPVLAIPEMMRLLMDEHGYGWDKAWNIVSKTFAYTNHTLLSEALEKWPCDYIKRLLPRIYMIIEEICRRCDSYVRKVTNNNEDVVRKVAIIKEGMVHMANIAVWSCFSVNGVAKLHTELLVNQEMKESYNLYPEKFNNKTNGVTHRRWLMYSNPKLAEMISFLTGDAWIWNNDRLEDMMRFVDDNNVKNRFFEIKKENKIRLKEYIKKHNNIDIDENSIFDVQIKRIHAYKRQSLNILNVIYQYLKMKKDPKYRIYPHTYIIGGKAAPSYYLAKKTIELINAVADVVNNDPETNKYLKLVFIENYDVSKAEIIIPAADVSEQISTAGKEASGTSNMKFMMNGAITLGTLDGANVEIVDRVGLDNAIIFGLKSSEVSKLHRERTYNSKNLYEKDANIKMVLNSLMDGTFKISDEEGFKVIFEDLVYHNDHYFVLKDFNEYIKAQDKVQQLYADKDKWAKICITNIAKSGYFTSDRTIEEYVRDIWKLDKINVN